jgi:hypothetical protein
MDDFSTWFLMAAPITGLAVIIITALAALAAHV